MMFSGYEAEWRREYVRSLLGYELRRKREALLLREGELESEDQLLLAAMNEELRRRTDEEIDDIPF